MLLYTKYFFYSEVFRTLVGQLCNCFLFGHLKRIALAQPIDRYINQDEMIQEAVAKIEGSNYTRPVAVLG